MSTPAHADAAALQALAELKGLRDLMGEQRKSLTTLMQAHQTENHRRLDDMVKGVNVRLDDHGARIKRLEDNERQMAQKVAGHSIVTSMVTSLLTAVGLGGLRGH